MLGQGRVHLVRLGDKRAEHGLGEPDADFLVPGHQLGEINSELLGQDLGLGFVGYFDAIAFVAVCARVRAPLDRLKKVLHSVPPGSHPLPGGLPQPGVSRQKDQGTRGDRGSVSL